MRVSLGELRLHSGVRILLSNLETDREITVSSCEGFSGGVCIRGPFLKSSCSAFVEFSSLPFIMPEVTFFLQLMLSYIFKPHQLPHLDLGASASLVGLVASCTTLSISQEHGQMGSPPRPDWPVPAPFSMWLCGSLCHRA